jgi:hypothetical protein
MSEELLVPKATADKVKAEELEAVRLLAKRRENRRRRSHMGDPAPVVCSVCKNGRTTLYNTQVVSEEGTQTEKRCGWCR